MEKEPTKGAVLGLGCGALALLFCAYLASVGPAALISERSGYPSWLTAAYAPVNWVVAKVPVLTTPYLWYVELWTGPPMDTS
jgi:hypothetical protein